jgi:hypothetical protein
MHDYIFLQFMFFVQNFLVLQSVFILYLGNTYSTFIICIHPTDLGISIRFLLISKVLFVEIVISKSELGDIKHAM